VGTCSVIFAPVSFPRPAGFVLALSGSAPAGTAPSTPRSNSPPAARAAPTESRRHGDNLREKSPVTSPHWLSMGDPEWLWLGDR